MAITKPIFLNETGKELVEVLREMKVAIASGKEPETTTWKEVRQNVRAGLGETLYPVGTKFVIYKYANGSTRAGAPVKYYLDAVAHNKHFLLRHGEPVTEYSMTLQFHELLNDYMQFDAAENQYGISLDTSVVPWKTYYSDASGTAVANPTGNPHENGYYEKNDTTAYPRSSYGSNNWRHSAIRKWLNADKGVAAGSWWAASTPFDKAPNYSSGLPFQALLADDADGTDATLLDVVGPVTVRTILNVIKNPDNSAYYLDADASGQYAVASRLSYDVTEDTFFLPTTKEIHCNAHNEEGGVLLQYYGKFSDYASPIGAWGNADTNLLKHKQNAGSASAWWLRSALTDIAYAAMVVYSSGVVDSDHAYDSNGVAPLCVIY